MFGRCRLHDLQDFRWACLIELPVGFPESVDLVVKRADFVWDAVDAFDVL